jgi:poly(3-hydroxybutyrate) depolymerase
MIKFLTTTIILCCAISVTFVQAQEHQTHTYFRHDTTELALDLFLPDDLPGQAMPLVIFVHGGGFSTGDKSAGHALARYLAKNNMACASISYTLYMKDKHFGCQGILSEKIKAIRMAVSQLWHATAWLIDRSPQYGIDTSRIFIAGSSAGAEAVIHAAYWDRPSMQLYDNKLSPEFQYAGVASGAGAIMDLSLITPENKVPMLFLHGDEDPLVPYATAAHHYCPPHAPGWLIFFGSYSIARHLHDLHGTYRLVTFQGGKHSYASYFVYRNHQPVIKFIRKVLSGEKFMEHQLIKVE